MDQRPTAAIEAGAIIRRAQSTGDFATVIRKGDPDRGALLLVIRSRDRHVACLERTLSPGGDYRWQKAGPAESSDPSALADFLQKRVRFDADSWIIELDVAQPERFIAETIASG